MGRIFKYGMRSILLAALTVVMLAVGGTFHTFAAEQSVGLSPSSSNQQVGGSFALSAQYNVSDGDNTLTGIGLRFHYDSSKLEFTGFSNVFSTDKIAEESTPQNDTNNDDSDASTDKYVSIAWTNIGGNWPNQTLPLDVAQLGFTAAAAGTAAVNVSFSSTAAGYDGSATNASVNISGGTTYGLTVQKTGTGTGTVTSSPTGIDCGSDCTEDYNENTQVILTATAGTDSTFSGWTGGGCSGTETCVVTMDQAQSVTAAFETVSVPTHSLTVQKDGSGSGTVNSSPTGIDCGSDCTEDYSENTQVTLTAAAATDSTFAGWTGGGCSGTGTCVVTMDQTQTVTATFSEVFVSTSQSVALSPSSSNQQVGGSFALSAQYNVSDGDNTLTGIGLRFHYDSSKLEFTGFSNVFSTDKIAEESTPQNDTNNDDSDASTDKYVSIAWTNIGGNWPNQTLPLDVAQLGFTAAAAGTAAVNVSFSSTAAGYDGSATNASVNISGGTTYGLTVQKTGTGTGTVTSSPTGIDCGSDCTEDYNENTQVILTATAGTDSTFSGWTGGGCSGTETCVVTMDQAQSVTAAFETVSVPTHSLTVQKDGSGSGTVNSSPTGIDCGSDCTEDYNENTQVILTAVPVTDSSFFGWTGGGCSGTGTCLVTMDQAQSVTATFETVHVPTHSLTVQKDGAGSGAVSSSPTGIDCGSDCTEDYNENTQVILTATAGTDSTFSGWTGGGCSGTGTCVVTIDQAQTVTATFNEVFVSTSQSVALSPSSSNQQVGGSFNLSAQYNVSDGDNTLTGIGLRFHFDSSKLEFTGFSNVFATDKIAEESTPQDDSNNDDNDASTDKYVSIAWTNIGGNWPNQALPLEVAQLGFTAAAAGTAVVNVSFSSTAAGYDGSASNAVINGGTTYGLTVQKDGTGTGSVTSSPAGIDCGADCREDYSENTQVTLTAAAVTDSSFFGWTGGGCSGTGTCLVTMDQAQSVTATFDDEGPVIPDGMTQIIILSPRNLDTPVGSDALLSAEYAVGDDDNTLTGIGLRFHFDSSKLQFTGFIDVFATDKIAEESSPQDDINDDDNDSNTDKYVSIAWASFSGEWPNQTLPLAIAKLGFSVISEGRAAVNVSFSSRAAGYDDFAINAVVDGGLDYEEKPLAVAGADFTAIADTTVALDGSYSQGAETYAWTTAAIPEGATANLSGADTAKPTFEPTVAGDYTFELIVNNGTEDSPKDSVTVTIVAAGSEEAAIVAVYASLTTAIQAYIAEPTEANMDAVMAHFSDSFNHDGMDKADLREEWSSTEEGLQNLLSFVAFGTGIVVDGMDADSIMTTIMMINDPWGEPFIEFDVLPMPLKKEGDTWLAYGNQNAYDVWVDTISRTDGTIILEFGLESQAGDIASVTVSGASIDGTLDLFDDGLHWDNEPEDDQWANRIKLNAAPTIGEVYTFTVSPAGGDPVVVAAEVTGIMDNAAGNGEVITSEFAPPTFSWDPVDGALFYAIQVLDETGEPVWGSYGIPSNFIEYQGPPLFGTYEWRVISFDANENRSVSELFTYEADPPPDCGNKSISGTVYGSGGTTPIPNIWVSAWSDSAMSGYGAETDTNGQYTIECLNAASDYRVDVWHPDYANQFYKKADGCALPTAAESVVDYNDCGIDPVGTSDWGQATLVDVYVNNAEGIDLIMNAGVTISGTVTDGTKGIGRVWVTAWSDEVGSWGGQETADDGTYVMRGLQEASDYRVEINDPRFAHQFYKYEGHEQDHLPPADNDYSGLTPIGTTIWEDVTLVATSEDNAAQGVNFIVAEGKKISGLILADGQPLEHVWVNAGSDSAGSWGGAETDESGEYTIHGLAPASDYRVDIWAEGYTYQVYNNQTDWEKADFVNLSQVDAESINFYLSAGKTISGRVVDDNSDGVSGVWVNAHSENNGFGRGEPTDTDGYYTISGLVDADDYRVDIWAEGYINQFYNGKSDWSNADLVDITTGSATNVNFTLSAGVYIEGTITLPTGDTEFGDIWVNAHSESTQMGRGEPIREEDVSGNTATYKIFGLGEADDYRVDIWSEKYGYKLYDNVNDWSDATLVSTVDGSQSNIDFTLTPGTFISGTVTGLAEGDYAWVDAYSESLGIGNGREVRGLSGGGAVDYTINGLRPATDYRIGINSDNYQNQFYNGKDQWENADPVIVTENGTTGIDFALSTGGTISGRVVDSEGNGVAYVWVDAWSEDGSWGGTNTDEDGNYTLSGLTEGAKYHVNIWHDEYANQGMGASTGDVGLDFTVSAGVSISGKVTDSSGVGIANAWVNAWSDSTDVGRGEPTDNDGNYLIKGIAASDDYRVDVWAEGYPNQFYNNQTQWDKADLVDTTVGSVSDINFTLAAGKKITGTITLPGSDTDFGDIWINVHSESAEFGRGEPVREEDVTGNSGTYEIKGLVAAEDYRVEFWSAQYQRVYYKEGVAKGVSDWTDAGKVDVTEDDATGIDITLGAGNTISGTVTANSQPVVDMWVNAWSEDTHSSNGASTDQDGIYTITGLTLADDYVVDIWSENYVQQFYNQKIDWNDADRVDISEDSATDIDFALSAGVYIEGTVTLPGGATDYNQVWVNAWSESSGGGGGGAPVETDGTYRIVGLAASDDYRVEVWSDEYGRRFYGNTNQWDQATLVDTTGGSQSNIDFALSAGAFVSGTVTGISDGDRAWVNAWSESTGDGNGTEVIGTGAPVSYIIKGLGLADDYRVELHSDGYMNQFYDGKSQWDEADSVAVTEAGATFIDFTVSSGATISGTVTDKDGNGVADVWVDSWSEDGSWGGANTDADGKFTISGLSEDTGYNVSIWHEDYANQFQQVKTGTGAAASVAFTVDAGVTISGTVSDGGGTPIANAWVNAWSESKRIGRGEPTDHNGNYLIRGIAAASDYRVDAWADGYGNQVYNNKVMWDEADLVDTTTGDATGIDFTLSTGKKISGAVTIPDGGPTHDIWVNAYSDTQGGMGAPVENWDGNTGTYEIIGLRAGNDYKVDVWSPNYQHVHYKEGTPAGVSDWMDASLVDVTTENAAGIDFQLGTGRKISGTVTVPEDGSYRHLHVNAGSESAGSWSGAPVESNGTYAITGLAAANDYRVDIWSEEYGYQIYNGKKNWEDADLVSTVDADATDINFTLSEGKSISGRITNTNGGGIADAWVNIWSERNRFGRGEPTDKDGYYTIKGIDAASDYKLDVWSEEYGLAMYRSAADGGGDNQTTTDWMLATELDVTVGNLSDIDMILSEGGSISGSVRDANGDPVQYAWVNAWAENVGGNGAETDASGDYTIKGLPSSDQYKVEVWSENFARMFYDQQTSWENADVVNITFGNATGIDFILSSGNTISGTVTAGEDPLKRIWVNAWSETAGSWGGAGTDSNGDYTIKGLAPADDYVVDVWSEQYAHQFYDQKTDWTDADRVDVSQGNAVDIDFDLMTGNSISGTIALPEGDTNYHRIWVNAWSDEKWSGNGSPVHHDGKYKIPGLIPGAGYKVDFHSDDYQHVFYKSGTANGTSSWDDATTIDITNESQEGIDITLSTGGSITGKVTADGTGIADVSMDAWSESTDSWGGANTDSDGNYAIKGLDTSATDFVVTVWPDEYQVVSQIGKKAGDTVDFTLSEGNKIRGFVKKHDGTPVADVWVDAWSAGADTGNGALTQSDGSFAITSLKPASDYTVSTWTDSGSAGQENVDISSGDAQVTLTLADPSLLGSISGTAKDPDGNVITSGELIVSVFNRGNDNNGNYENSIKASLDDGSFEIKNLPDGEYHLKFHHSDHGTQWCGPIDGAFYPGQSGRSGAAVFQPGATVDFRFSASQ